MTDHDHRTVVPGCYRCELSADEAEEAMREELLAAEHQKHSDRRRAETMTVFGEGDA